MVSFSRTAISSSYVSCQCRPGFTGNGFGQTGCVPLGDGGSSGGGGGGGGGGPINYNEPCSPNPCVFGTCSRVGVGFQCTCQAGYAGKTFIGKYFETKLSCNISQVNCATFLWILV